MDTLFLSLSLGAFVFATVFFPKNKWQVHVLSWAVFAMFANAAFVYATGSEGMSFSLLCLLRGLVACMFATAFIKPTSPPPDGFIYSPIHDEGERSPGRYAFVRWSPEDSSMQDSVQGSVQGPKRGTASAPAAEGLNVPHSGSHAKSTQSKSGSVNSEATASGTNSSRSSSNGAKQPQNSQTWRRVDPTPKSFWSSLFDNDYGAKSNSNAARQTGSSGGGFSIGDGASSINVTPHGHNTYYGSNGTTWHSSNGVDFAEVNPHVKTHSYNPGYSSDPGWYYGTSSSSSSSGPDYSEGSSSYSGNSSRSNSSSRGSGGGSSWDGGGYGPGDVRYPWDD